jgi:hypothetical protein
MTARWLCKRCDDVYCSKCFKHIHRKGKLALHTATPLEFFTMELLRRKRDRDAQAADGELARQRAKEIQDWQKYRERQHQSACAVKIQATWRGYIGRRDGKTFMRQEQTRRRKLDRQRELDDSKRAKISYKLLRASGIAPRLLTDDIYTVATRRQSLLRRPGRGEVVPGEVAVSGGSSVLMTTTDMRSYLPHGTRIRLGGLQFTVQRREHEPLTERQIPIFPSFPFGVEFRDLGAYAGKIQFDIERSEADIAKRRVVWEQRDRLVLLVRRGKRLEAKRDRNTRKWKQLVDKRKTELAQERKRVAQEVKAARAKRAKRKAGLKTRAQAGDSDNESDEETTDDEIDRKLPLHLQEPGKMEAKAKALVDVDTAAKAEEEEAARILAEQDEPQEFVGLEVFVLGKPPIPARLGRAIFVAGRHHALVSLSGFTDTISRWSRRLGTSTVGTRALSRLSKALVALQRRQWVIADRKAAARAVIRKKRDAVAKTVTKTAQEKAEEEEQARRAEEDKVAKAWRKVTNDLTGESWWHNDETGENTAEDPIAKLEAERKERDRDMSEKIYDDSVRAKMAAEKDAAQRRLAMLKGKNAAFTRYT